MGDYFALPLFNTLSTGAISIKINGGWAWRGGGIKRLVGMGVGVASKTTLQPPSVLNVLKRLIKMFTIKEKRVLINPRALRIIYLNQNGL